MTDASNNLWVYKWFWSGDRKVQNAWGKWTFDDCQNILWGTISQEKLYILVRRSDGVSIESINLSEDVFTSNTDFTPLVDRLVTIDPGDISYDDATGISTVTLPYDTEATVDLIASEPGFSITALKNIRYPVTKVSNTVVQVPADLTDQEVTVGVPYNMVYTFSPFYIRQPKGNGEVVILDGRLQVRYLTLEYHDTFYFRAVVSRPGREDSVTEFTGQILGSQQSTLGSLSFEGGVFRIPIMGENTATTVKIENDTPYPCYFGSAEVLAQYFPKAARRV
jgi:hypothetical protein